MNIFIDGDFASGKGNCKYHCSPSCHPMQTGGESGTEWFYGCTHKAWPQNRANDFVPIVNCGGDINNCSMIGKKFLSHYARGLRTRASNANKKLVSITEQLNELRMLMDEE